MADPTFRASTTQDLSSPTTITVAQPAGTTSGDVVVLLIITGTPTANTPATWTPPSGWNQMSGSPFSASLGNGKLNVVLCWGLPGSINFSNTFAKSGGSGSQFVGVVCESWQNTDNTTPVNVIAGSLSTSNNLGTLTVAAITTTVDRCVQLVAIGDVADGQLTITGFTKVENAAAQQAAAIDYKNSVQTPAGSTGTVNVADSGGSSGNSIAAISFALQPAAQGVQFAAKGNLWVGPTIIGAFRVGPPSPWSAASNPA